MKVKITEIEKKIQWEKIEEFKKYNTPNISDALDKLGINGQLLNIKPLQFGFKFVAPVFTVKYVPVGAIKGTAGDFIDDVPSNFALLLDNEGRNDCTVWGGIMTKLAVRNRIAATIINGVCRDVDEILKYSYPMFIKSYYMRTGKDRAMMYSVNETVSVSNVQINPGDIAVGDDNGVIIIPLGQEEQVLRVTRQIFQAEEKIESMLDQGSSLSEARQKVGYHKLQRKD